MLPKMEMTDPILQGFLDSRNEFVDMLCVKLWQCPKKEREKEQEKVEGEVNIKKHGINHLGPSFCDFT